RLDDLGKAHVDLVERTERSIRDQLATISDATRLFDLLQRSTLHKESIAGLVALSARVPTATPDLVRSLTQAQVDRTSLFLDQLSRGAELTYEGEDRDWLLALTQLAKNSIDGTTAAGVAFWNSELGTRYLEYQRQAISRGVAVRRIFMLENDSPSAVIRRACRTQTEAGIVVRLLDASTIYESREIALPELVVFDSEVSYELSRSVSLDHVASPQRIRTHLAFTPRHVHEQMRRYEELWALSTDFE